MSLFGFLRQRGAGKQPRRAQRNAWKQVRQSKQVADFLALYLEETRSKKKAKGRGQLKKSKLRDLQIDYLKAYRMEMFRLSTHSKRRLFDEFSPNDFG